MQKLIYKIIVLTAALLAAQPALANEKPKPKAKGEHGGGHGGAGGEADAKTTNEFLITDKYVHSWIKMPALVGRSVSSSESTEFKTERGEAGVVIFLASWCLPCQQIILQIKALEAKYAQRHTRFLYVFTHDTVNDALGFTVLYKLGNNTMVATHKILDDFHQPELPTIYVSDRMQWLTMRLRNTDHEGLKRLDAFLEVHTSY